MSNLEWFNNVISGSTPFGIYDTDTLYQTDGR